MQNSRESTYLFKCKDKVRLYNQPCSFTPQIPSLHLGRQVGFNLMILKTKKLHIYSCPHLQILESQVQKLKTYVKAHHLVFVILTLNMSARWLECFSAFHGGLAQDISMMAQPTLHTSQLRPYCCPLSTCSSTVHHTKESAAGLKSVSTSITKTIICIVVRRSG